tara:strand:- start:1313 stop:2308 length:996 start_codon:yes stop_codon:yes gene_type:complete
MNGIPFSKEEIKQVSLLYQSGESTSSIAKKFNRCPSLIKLHLDKSNVKIRSRSDAAKLGVAKGRIKIFKHSLPIFSRNMNLEKSYILGTLCGDGFLSYGKNGYHIGLSVINKEFFNEFRRCLYKVYEIKPTNELRIPKVKNWSNQYCTRLCSKAACEDIINYGQFGMRVWKVPKIIKESNLQIQANFIRGFADSEGNVDKNARRVSLTSTNIEGLKEVGELLKNFKIRYTIIKRTKLKENRVPSYNLRIQDRRSIETFHKHISFIINYKKEKLKDIVDNYKLYTTPYTETIKLRPLMIKLRKKGLTYKEISEELGIGMVTVWSHLQKEGIK